MNIDSTAEMAEIRAKAAEHYDGEKGFANAKRLNAYECDGEMSFRPGVPDKPGCGHYIVTIDREPGVTPFIVRCGNCGQSAHSKFYRVASHLKPTHEWYRPDSLDGLRDGEREHVRKGGLLLSSINGQGWLPPEQSDQDRIAAMKKAMDDAMADARKEPALSRQAQRHEKRKAKAPPETVTMYGRTYRLVEDEA